MGCKLFDNFLLPGKKEFTLAFLIPLFFSSTFSTHAQPPDTPSAEAKPSLSSSLHLDLEPRSDGIWANDTIGDGFRHGVQQASFTVGGGFCTSELGGVSSHNMVLAQADYGWMIGDVFCRNQCCPGNWEIMQELFGGAQVRPRYAYAVGLTTLLRYNFVTGSRWVPFVCCGLGVSATDISRPDLSSTFEFNIQSGAGVNYFLNEHTALIFQYRYIHISDAGMTTPNQGVNESTFSTGISWFF